MKRRMLVGGLGFTALAASGAFAQTSQRVARVAFLSPAASDSRPAFLAFRARLGELGWIEGQNLSLKFYLSAGAGPQFMESMAREIASSSVDVVFADGGTMARTMAAASRTIPIVSIMGIDPTISGLAATLARPGGNVTGFTIFSELLNAKRLELLREMAPAAKRVGAIISAGISEDLIGTMLRTGTGLGFDMHRILIDGASDFQSVLSGEALTGIDAVAVMTNAFVDAIAGRIVGPLNAARKPAIYPGRTYAEIGGMMSYGIDFAAVFRRLAEYVNRVLRGESPAAIPFEQPERFELVLNMRTLRLLGLSVPPIILARADEVIE